MHVCLGKFGESLPSATVKSSQRGMCGLQKPWRGPQLVRTRFLFACGVGQVSGVELVEGGGGVGRGQNSPMPLPRRRDNKGGERDSQICPWLSATGISALRAVMDRGS